MIKQSSESSSFNDHAPHLGVLKNVSRSFYLSIRILPKEARLAVCLAYLFARAADSIADSPVADVTRKNQLLNGLKNLLHDYDPSKIVALQEQALPLLNHEVQEQNLINALPNIFATFLTLSQQESALVSKVVSILISGMLEDMHAFPSDQPINALKTEVDLDHYTYLVAGCVGEFWTEILELHYGKILQWNAKQQIEYGIRFGKALQLTNILRDIQKDALIGRCYLPEEELIKHNLTANDILNSDNILAEKIIPKYLILTLEHYKFAELYLLNTPRKSIRLRLAALWPIAIGLKTLSLIKAQAQKKNKKPVKIARKQVYTLLLISPLLILSNTLTSWYLEKLRQNI